MCGILGFIGRSRNPRVSFEMANALLLKTETRGEHATGFWSCECGDNRVFFDKEPIKSSIYASRSIWQKEFSAANTDLLLGHCRFTSVNVGHERYNKNNHPHVSDDRRVALVHNGKIPEYGALKSRYDLRSDCDSEILLGMFESSESYKGKEEFLKKEFPNLTPDIAYRMMGLKEVFSRVNWGAMAVAIGERGENTTSRHLWLFRDEERPLHVVDMRKTLGQIFFCSTAEIWRNALEACPAIKPYVPDDQVLIEFPPYQVWMLVTDVTEDPEVNSWRIKKFRITKTKFYDWKDDDHTKILRPKRKPVAIVVTRLGADEELKKDVVASGPPTSTVVTAPESRKKKINQGVTQYHEPEDVQTCDNGTEDDCLARHAASATDAALEELSPVVLEPMEIDMEAFDTMMKELRTLITDVETSVRTLQRENSLEPRDFSTLMDSLKDAHAEIKGSLIFLQP